MANKERQRLTQGVIGYGASLETFRNKACRLTGDFTFSAAINHQGYRVLHGLGQDDIERLILAQVDHPVTVLNVWAVFR